MAALFAFEVWYSSDYLVTRRYDFASPKLSQPVTAVVLSDLHDHAFGAENRRLIEAVAGEQPDAILVLGDMLNRDTEDTAPVVELTAALHQIAPVYYALGNHENDYMLTRGRGLLEELEAAGAQVLDLSYVDADIGGQIIRIGGMYDYAFAQDATNSTKKENMPTRVYDFLTGFQDTEHFTLMLSHRPESFVLGEASVTWTIDLTVHGHAHGGQVVLPFVGGLWAGDQGFFPTYVHGMYEKDLLHILVTSGLGTNKTAVPRLNNPPEVVVLNLLPEEIGET
ncbi:MAG: metallophosphoesterase [Candidatus Ventricola sp.]